jgi:hypothetical protein
MHHLKTKVILLNFKYPKTYEAYPNHLTHLTLISSFVFSFHPTFHPTFKILDSTSLHPYILPTPLPPAHHRLQAAKIQVSLSLKVVGL